MDGESVYTQGIEDCITDSTHVLERIEEQLGNICKAITEANRLKTEHLKLITRNRGTS